MNTDLPPRSFCAGGCGDNILEAIDRGEDPENWWVTDDNRTDDGPIYSLFWCPECVELMPNLETEFGPRR